MVYTKFVPTWKEYEKDFSNPDGKVQEQAADKFIAEREHQLRTDPKARRWETSRKEAIASEKPKWVKKRINEEKAPQRKILEDLKKGGRFDTGLVPCPGYLIVEIDSSKETKTDSGIVLAEVAEAPKNTGFVLAIGEALYCKHCFTHPDAQPTIPPAKVGDRILFKKGAGLEVTVKDSTCYFMAFSDVLARLEES